MSNFVSGKTVCAYLGVYVVPKWDQFNQGYRKSRSSLEYVLLAMYRNYGPTVYDVSFPKYAEMQASGVPWLSNQFLVLSCVYAFTL